MFPGKFDLPNAAIDAQRLQRHQHRADERGEAGTVHGHLGGGSGHDDAGKKNVRLCDFEHNVVRNG